MKPNTVFGTIVVLALAAVAVLFGLPAHAGADLGPLALTPFLLNTAISADEIKALETAMTKKAGELVEAVQKALRDEVKEIHTLTGKTNEKLTEIATEAKKATDALSDTKARLLEIEQKMAKKPVGGSDDSKSPGSLVTESAEYKAVIAGNLPNMQPVNVGSFHKTNVVNATGQNQPLVADMRVPGIITPAQRRLTIRDLLPQLRTNSNLVQFASESVFTNNAGPQYEASPERFDGVAKPESGLTFTLSNAAVATIAHWLPASRQVLADAQGLQGYIDSRLIYGLKLEEEDEILNGDGTSGTLNGLINQATAFNRGATADTQLDTLLNAMLQVALSDYSATGIVLNPIDWTTIRLLKDTTGRYLFGDPQSDAAPRVWGLPVVATNSATSGEFLVGAFALAAAIWDREDATVRVSEHHANFFVQNMVAILAEERMALTVYRAASIVTGTFHTAGQPG